MSQIVDEFIRDIHTAFSNHANPEVAVPQQAYMKSEIPYYGLKAAHVRKLMKPLLKKHTLQSAEEWELAIRTLWESVTHREEWYAALSIARYGRYRDYRSSPVALPLYDYLIREGAWWDVCDEIAHHLVGEVLMAHRE